MPLMMWVAATFTAVMPDPQKRSSVKAGARVSQPASSTAMRPMQKPCLPNWALQPTTTSSTAAVSRSLRSARARKTVPSSRWGWISASAPFPTLPMPRGVRTASMMLALGMAGVLGVG